MTDLQIGLLVIGAIVVAGVLLFNRLQERRARRAAEQAFRSSAADALLAESPARAETPPAEARPPQGRPVALPQEALPDPRVDYVVTLSFAAPASLAVLREQWKPFEHRYAKRALLAYAADGGSWRRLGHGDGGHTPALHAGLQLVTRDGAASDAELIEFRAAVDTLAAATGASVNAPEMREALERARELDRFCTDADVEVVMHVIPATDGVFAASRVRGLAEAAGLSLEKDGRFARRDAEGGLRYVLSKRDGGAFAPHAAAEEDLPSGLSLTLDVARTPDTAGTYQAMAALARQLAAALEGVVVDDNGQALDDHALAAIETQLSAVRAAFAAKGIEPGSGEALRLFS